MNFNQNDTLLKHLGDTLEYFGLKDMDSYQHCDTGDYKYSLIFTYNFRRFRFQENPGKQIMGIVDEFRESFRNSRAFMDLKDQHQKEIQTLEYKIKELEKANFELIEHIDNGLEMLDD
mgnify:CR=1 FL=1